MPDSPAPRPPDADPLPHLVRALVQAGGRCTAYLRGGSGRPVLVLAPDATPPLAPGVDGLVRALLATHRVLLTDATEAPGDERADDARAPGDDFVTWLRDFLDGVGLERALVVALDELAPPLVQFAAHSPARLERAALVLGDVRFAREAEPLAAALREARVPALVLHLPDGDVPPVAQRAAIARFLGGDDATSSPPPAPTPRA